MLGASIICSNDYDIKEVIQDTPIYVTYDEAFTNALLKQDTLVNFCFYTIKYGVEKSRVVRRFLNVVDDSRVSDLCRLLEDQ